MSKKVIPLTLTILLLAASTFSIAAAHPADEEVLITVWSNGSHMIKPGQVGVVRAGWGACSPGLVRVFIKASNFALELDGEPLLSPDQVDDLWGSIEPCPTCPTACLGNPKPRAASWRFVLPDLPSGNYELRTTIWIDHKFMDGSDYDGDGEPDFFHPDEFYFETLNTITVVGGFGRGR